MATTTYTAKVVATQAKNGPIVKNFPMSEIPALALAYTTDYPKFLSMLDSYVNTEAGSIEQSLPEGTPVKVVLPGLKGNAIGWAQALDQQWQQGKIKDPQGKRLKPWPGASQFAYASVDGNTLTLEWVKEFYWLEFTIGVIITLIVAYAAYEMLHGSQYSMTAYTPATGTGTGTGTGTTGTTPINTTTAASGILAWSVRNWPVLVLGGAGLVAAPFVMRELARTREAENEYRYAERGGY